MKKKLLVTASTFPRWEGDTEPRFILDLSAALTKYYDVTVLVPAAPGAADHEIMDGVEVVRYHYFPVHRWETLCYPGAIVPRIKEKKVRIFLVPCMILSLFIHAKRESKKVDVVQAHWLIPQGIVQSFFKKPYIVTGHGTDVTSMNTGIMRTLKRRALVKAKTITVVSDHLKNTVEKIEKTSNLHVISMGCKVENFSKDFFVKNYFGQGDRPVILFVGRLAEVKGVTYLIEAMKLVDAQLVIAGCGPQEKQLKAQAEEQGDKIQFLGSKTHEELKIIYASADVFVAPSITTSEGIQEGLGLVILEAMASGLPVVASRSGGIIDLIQHGQNGLLADEKSPVSIAENINEILNHPEKRKKLEKEARETALRYDYANIAKRYAEILDFV